MRFNSVQFLIFFPIVVLGYFVVPEKIKNIWLLIASYYFYMSWHPVYALLILFSTVTTFACGMRIGKTESQSAKKRYLTRNIVVNIAILLYFKYFNFLVESALALIPSLSIKPNNNLVAVVGISFYTFQSLGYSIDVYREKVEYEKNFLRYALFVSFFPQLVAGPIERSANLLPQLKKTYKFDYDRVTDGLVQMAWGFFKKIVIADGVATIVNLVYNDIYSFSGVSIIVATVLFAFQVYCDFSGYSDIAIGAANVIGIKLMRNFDHPYFSQNVTEFWRRWHISLSGWFTEYIYIPLGGSRKGIIRTCINLLIVFFVSGLWHGAAWTYVIWGLINGVYLIIERLIRYAVNGGKKTEKKNPVLAVLNAVKTFIVIDLSWVFFRANTVSDAMYAIGEIFSEFTKLFSSGYLAQCLEMTGFYDNRGTAVVRCILLMIVAELWEGRGALTEKINKLIFPLRWVIYYAIIIIIFVFGSFGQSRFIYFQF